MGLPTLLGVRRMRAQGMWVVVALALFQLGYVATVDTEKSSVSHIGCSDWSREGLRDVSKWPRVSACASAWSVPGIGDQGSASGATCGYTTGNDGEVPSGLGCSIHDSCAPGWHVCESHDEVVTLGGQCQGDIDGAQGLFLTRQSPYTDSECTRYRKDTVRGCGAPNIPFQTSAQAVAEDTGAAARCVASRTSGFYHSELVAPWSMRGPSLDLRRHLHKTSSQGGGVMCCLDKRPTTVNVLPPAGPATGGTRITVEGLDLGTHPEDVVSVKIGGVACDDIEWISSGKLECTTRAVDSTQTQVSASSSSASLGSPVIVDTKSLGPGIGFASAEYLYISDDANALAGQGNGLRIDAVRPLKLDPDGGILHLLVPGLANYTLGSDTIHVMVGAEACRSVTKVGPTELSCRYNGQPYDLDNQLITGDLAVIMRVNSRGITVAPNKVRYRGTDDPVCLEECSFSMECQRTGSGTACQCRAGWTGPSCDEMLIIESVSGESGGKATITEDGGTLTFSVQLSVKPDHDVTINYRTTNTEEAGVSPSRLVFNAGNWEEAQTVTMTGVNDHECDGDEYVAVVRDTSSKDSRFSAIPATVPRSPLVVNNNTAGAVVQVYPDTISMIGEYVFVITRDVCYDAVFRIDARWYVPLATTSIVRASRLPPGLITKGRAPRPETERIPSRNITTGTSGSPRMRILSHDQLSLTRDLGSFVTLNSNLTNGVVDSEYLYLPDGYKDHVFKLPNETVTEGYRRISLGRKRNGVFKLTTINLKDNSGQLLVSPSEVEDLGDAGLDQESLYITEKCTEPGWFGAGSLCRPCPEGAECPGGFRAKPLPGYWSRDETSGLVSRCPRPESCLGGDNVGEILCADGYTGYLCGDCAAEHFKQNGRCLPCPPVEDATYFILCDAVLWGGLGICGIVVNNQMLFSYIIMTVKSLQLLANVGHMGTEKLPDWLQTTYSFLHLFSGDYAFLKPDCLNPVTVEEEFYNSLVYNLAIFLPLLWGVPLCGIIKVWWMRCRNYEQYMVQQTKEWFQDRTVRCFIIFLATVYLPVMTRSVSMMSCIRGGTQFYMINAPQQICYEDMTYWRPFGVAVGFAVVLGITWPAYMAWYLTTNKERQLEERFGERFNFMYEFYKQGFTLFWIIEFMISCVLACAGSILVPHPKYQLSICTVVFGLKLFFILWKGPYLDWITNSIQIFLTIALLFAVNANYLLSLDVAAKVTGLREGMPIAIMVAMGATLASLIAMIVYKAVTGDDKTKHNDMDKLDGGDEIHGMTMGDFGFATGKEGWEDVGSTDSLSVDRPGEGLGLVQQLQDISLTGWLPEAVQDYYEDFKYGDNLTKDERSILHNAEDIIIHNAVHGSTFDLPSLDDLTLEFTEEEEDGEAEAEGEAGVEAEEQGDQGFGIDLGFLGIESSTNNLDDIPEQGEDSV